MTKQRGKKMGGLGCHYSGTEKKPVTGHSLVQGLYLVLGRRCPSFDPTNVILIKM
jgi:hypothetical protein